MGTVAIGPIAFSIDVLVVLAAMLLGTTTGNRVAGAGGVQVAASTLWWSFACPLLAARAAFVLRYSNTCILAIRRAVARRPRWRLHGVG